MPDIYTVAQGFRAELLRGEARVANDLVQAYGRAWVEIRDRLNALTALIAAEKDAGRPVNPDWLFRRERLQALQGQTEEQIRRFVDLAEARIRKEQETAIAAALQHSETLVRESVVGISQRSVAAFHHLPASAVEDLVGFLSEGSPLRAVLDQMPGQAGEALRKALIRGVTLGQHPRKIAAAVREDLGGQLGHSLTLSRTAVLAAYRESTRRSYEENSDVVEGWIWTAALGPRCCRACVALHGTFHPNTERLDGHPNCRCVMVPRTAGGIALETGIDWFERQPEDVQREILGPLAARAYRAGEVQLTDFIGHRHDDVWGSMRYARSLKQVRGT